MNQALIIRDEAALTVDFSAEAAVLKSDALERSGIIGAVTGAASQDQAVASQREITNLLNQVEKARKACKEPFLEAGRMVDDKARAFSQELKEEQLRLARLVGDFQQLEAARVRAAEQARLAEERKLEEERRAAERAALLEAEIAKKKLAEEAAALARKEAEAKNAEQKRRIEAERLELERQRKLAEAKSHEALDKINEEHCKAVADLPVAAPVRAQGQRVRDEWEIQVTDIWLLAKAHPTCVKIEPRLSEIKELLDTGAKVSGVRAEKKIRAGVFAGRAAEAIDV